MTTLNRRIKGANVTYGEALARKIRALALQGSVRADKLLHARVAREKELAKRRAEFEEYEKRKADGNKHRPDIFREFEAHQLFVEALEKKRLGLLTCITEAQELGLIEFREGEYVIVEAAKTYIETGEE